MSTVLEVLSVIGRLLLGIAAVVAATLVAIIVHRLPGFRDGWFDGMVEERQNRIWPWIRRMNTDLFTREQKVDYATWLERDRRYQRSIARWVVPPFLIVFGILVASAAVVPAFR